MKKVEQDGKIILLFEDVEELKWHFHTLLCRCEEPVLNESLMNQCVKQKNVNEWLERMHLPYKVKES